MEIGIKAEIWNPVVGYEGLYAVSNCGRIKRVGAAPGATVGRILKNLVHTTGYLMVNLWADRIEKTHYIHSLVAKAFLGPYPEGKEINHKDGNKVNNFLENLEYVTHSENSLHAYKMGLTSMPPQDGKLNGSSKLTQEQVDKIRLLYSMGTFTQTQLGKEFGVSRQSIRKILIGKTWGAK